MKSSINVGDRLPSFSLPAQDGSLVALPAGKPTILVFFRGHWCPYCRWELTGLQTINNEVTELGGEVIGVSPDSAVDSDELRGRLHLAFKVLSDDDLAVTDVFGLRHVGGQASTGTDMPFPTTFIVDEAGVVRQKFENETYKDRPSPRDVLAAFKTVLSVPA
jgi:peroxiredoxin